MPVHGQTPHIEFRDGRHCISTVSGNMVEGSLPIRCWLDPKKLIKMFKEQVIKYFFQELVKKREFNSYGGKCIDIFFETYNAKNPIDTINYTVQIANELSNRNLLELELEIQIYIELIDDFTHLKGLPRTQVELHDELLLLFPI